MGMFFVLGYNDTSLLFRYHDHWNWPQICGNLIDLPLKKAWSNRIGFLWIDSHRLAENPWKLLWWFVGFTDIMTILWPGAPGTWTIQRDEKETLFAVRLFKKKRNTIVPLMSLHIPCTLHKFIEVSMFMISTMSIIRVYRLYSTETSLSFFRGV